MCLWCVCGVFFSFLADCVLLVMFGGEGGRGAMKPKFWASGLFCWGDSAARGS